MTESNQEQNSSLEIEEQNHDPKQVEEQESSGNVFIGLVKMVFGFLMMLVGIGLGIFVVVNFIRGLINNLSNIF